MAPVEERALTRVRISHGPAVLNAVINGVSFAEIAQSEGLSLKQVETALRKELRKRWIASAQDYARLQIARLEDIANKLKEKSKNAHLPTIDRLLRVMDRLDRYHGFTKLAGRSKPSANDVHRKLDLMYDMATREPARSK